MTTTITYEGTLPGSRIEGELVQRHPDGSVTVAHPDGNGWTYRVRPEHIIAERTVDTFASLLERMSNLASIPLDAREQFNDMLLQNFTGSINDDIIAEGDYTFGERAL